MSGDESNQMSEGGKMAEQTVNNVVSNSNEDDAPNITLDELINGDPELQSQYDKKVQAAMAKNLEKAKVQWKAEAEAEKLEAEKLAKMSEEEKRKVELEKIEKERNQAISDLNAYKLQEEAQKIAREKGLDATFLSYFDFHNETAETLLEKIDDISVFVKKAIEDGINEKLKQVGPKQVHQSSQSAEKAYLDAKYGNNKYYQK